jgi:hypothetical protein
LVPSFLAIVATATVALACSDGDEGGGGGASSSGGAACIAAGLTLIPLQDRGIVDLSWANDRVVFVTKDLRAVDGRANIEVMAVDGSGRTVLYADSAARRLRGVRAEGDTVFFLEAIERNGRTEFELMSVPVAGGTPSRLGTEDFKESRIFAADAQFVYLSKILVTGQVFLRVARAGGGVETIATLPGVGTPSQATLAGGQIYFRAGKSGGGEPSQLYRVAANATNGTAERLLPGGDLSICDLNLAGFVPTPTRLACGYRTFKTAALDGTDIRTIATSAVGEFSYVLLRGDGETLFVMDAPNKGRAARIGTIGADGAGRVELACDVGLVQSRNAYLSFPVVTEYDVAVSPTHFFWIEAVQEGTVSRFALRAAERRR